MVTSDSAPAWIGVLDVFGIAVLFLVWNYLRGSGDRVRALAAAVGATFVAVGLAGAVNGLTRVASRLAASGFDGFGERGNDTVRNSLVAVLGLAAGLVVVFVGHRRLSPVEEPDEDEPIEELAGTTEVIEQGNHNGYDDEDYLDDVPPRPDLSRWAPWFDVLVLALAVALPAAVISTFTNFPFTLGSDVTVTIALVHVWSGLYSATILLVLLARPEAYSRRLVAAAFGIVALGAVVAPVFPEAMANEVWIVLELGIAAGLLAGVAFALMRPAITAPRGHAVIGGVIAIVMATAGAYLTTRTYIEAQELRREQFSQGRLP